MGTHWGVGKVMAEIQALLFLSNEPLSLEDMSDRLKTSRSHISLNVRALQDLGVVRKVIIPSDRKDYYTTDGNLGRVVRRLAAKKKRRELDPALRIIDQAIHASNARPGTETQTEKLHELKTLMEGIAGILDTFIDDDQSLLRSEETIKA